MPQVEIARPSHLRFGEPGFYEAYGAAWGFRDLLVSFFAPDGVYTDKASQVLVEGQHLLDRFMKVYLRFSPNCTVTFTSVHEHPGGFTAEWVWAGTNDGPLRLHGFECPCDGSHFSIEGVSVCSVDEKGRITSHTDYWDSEALLRIWRKAPAT
ncbi:MAG TPA: nuclear transport factor 2 family protein [Nocardioides sp.]|nr:nuclear transport factor 2 family protein [Nocardioides sp.]